MEQSVIYEVSEILDTFNLEEISKLLQQQISSSENSELGLQTVDHFKPLYYKYQGIMRASENTGEIKEAATERFMNICNIFLTMICRKYGIAIDPVWKDDHYGDLPGFTMALYNFFVLDVSSNIYDVCIEFIKKNKSMIYEAFEERKNKKDASTLVYKKIMSPEMAVITSNIYDVSTWILTQLSEEQFLNYLNPDYLPLKLIKTLLEEGILSGEFMVELNDIYSSDLILKSDVCFRLISYLKTNQD